MTATVNTSANKKAWASVVLEPAKEFSHTPLPTISGKIPQGLRGTLYRNGPGRLERGGVRMGHWFDGDGAILAVHFNDKCVSAVYRYVQTTGYKEESAADKLIYGNYGMLAHRFLWDKIFKGVKNAANTSVLALPDKLLALWEGGKPYALNLKTLDTYGEDDLGGLSDILPYSAHFKRAADTGEIYNFGMTPGLNSTLNVYKSTASGRIVQKAAYNTNGIPLVHDFVLAGQYLIFFISPVRLNLLAVITGSKCFSDALEWLPNKGTQIIVIDRQTLKIISRGETEPWYQWHFSNGYVDDSGAVIVDIARYDDFQTNQYLKEVATGETHTPAKSHLSRVTLNPQTGKVSKIEKLTEEHCEFPNVPPECVGKDSRYTYLSTFKPGTDISTEILNAIGCYDHHTGALTVADVGENRYPSEPIYVKDLENTSQAWIITVVYDGKSNASEVWIYDASRLNSEPVCKLELPGAIPHSFHGTWKE